MDGGTDLKTVEGKMQVEGAQIESKKAVWEGSWPNPQTAFLEKNSFEFNGFYKPR